MFDRVLNTPLLDKISAITKRCRTKSFVYIETMENNAFVPGCSSYPMCFYSMPSKERLDSLQPTVTCSKLTIEALEQDAKCVQS